jgi:hypothetical protein
MSKTKRVTLTQAQIDELTRAAMREKATLALLEIIKTKYLPNLTGTAFWSIPEVMELFRLYELDVLNVKEA